jgi:phosphoglycolate phosphatase-like HAD superfamily hydrolase
MPYRLVIFDFDGTLVRQLRLAPDSVLCVGDETRDIEAARRWLACRRQR